jgi:hypothetical protein
MTPEGAVREPRAGDFLLLGAVGWLLWPAVAYLLVKSLLELNAVTGQPADIIIRARRRAMLTGVVCAVDLVLAVLAVATFSLVRR